MARLEYSTVHNCKGGLNSAKGTGLEADGTFAVFEPSRGANKTPAA